MRLSAGFARVASVLLVAVALLTAFALPASADVVQTSVSMTAKDTAGNAASGVTMSITLDDFMWPVVGSCVTGADGRCTATFQRDTTKGYFLQAYKSGLGYGCSGVYYFGGSAPYYGDADYQHSIFALHNRPPRG